MKALIQRLIDKIIPPMPDFFALISEQCALCEQTMEVFVSYMEDGDSDKATLIHQFEKQGDSLKHRNNRVLDKAFTTPMDREDIYDAIISIDEIINYAHTTVREMEILGLQPDHHMLAMAMELQKGAASLQSGFARLTDAPARAEHDAMKARKSERRVEAIYRQAIGELFHSQSMEHKIPAAANGNGHQLLAIAIMDIFKHREIYRHMSNGADRLAHAANKLNDIIVKIT